MTLDQLSNNDRKAFKAVFLRLIGTVTRDKAAQRRAIIEADRTCMVCGRKTPLVKSHQGAHIIPHEEGGSKNASDNLVCLCTGEVGTLARGAMPKQVGCHQLFDNYQVWSRQEMLRLRRSIGTSEYEATATAMIGKRDNWAAKLADIMQLALINRRWRQARDLARQQLKQASPAQQAKTLRQLVVAARKSYGRSRWAAIAQLVRDLTQILNDESIPESERASIGYEFGMILFQLRRFEEAAAKFESSAAEGDPCSQINQAQAIVSRYEATTRGHKSREDVEKLIANLRLVIGRIDEHCTDKEVANYVQVVLCPWRTDARLHLARMLARLEKNSESRNLIDEAKRFRGEAIAEPAVFSSLMLAEGEVALMEEDYEHAAEAFGRAGFKIADTGAKEFEYLEIVFDRLLEIPRGKIARLDHEHETLRQLQRSFRNHLNWLKEISVPI